MTTALSYYFLPEKPQLSQWLVMEKDFTTLKQQLAGGVYGLILSTVCHYSQNHRFGCSFVSLACFITPLFDWLSRYYIYIPSCGLFEYHHMDETRTLLPTITMVYKVPTMRASVCLL
jgi:hypothetical protein